MGIEDIAEKLMRMDDETWEKHAHPLSGWTRVAVLPLLTLAIWSRVWIGWWALALVGLCLLWTWYNPRAFPKPKRIDNWMSRGVYGERVWLARKTHPIPQHHVVLPNILNVGGGLALVFYAAGLYQLHVLLTLFGVSVIILCKLWFLDRMVWLWYDTQSQDA